MRYLLFVLIFISHGVWADEEGFELSEVAQRNFGVKTQKLEGSGPWPVSSTAVVRSNEEVNLYRFRDGRFFRVDFEIVSQSPEQLKVLSQDLQAGDAVVLQGIGFLRIAEIAASGGVEHGHSH